MLLLELPSCSTWYCWIQAGVGLFPPTLKWWLFLLSPWHATVSQNPTAVCSSRGLQRHYNPKASTTLIGNTTAEARHWGRQHASIECRHCLV
jgi:hypothetical protein